MVDRIVRIQAWVVVQKDGSEGIAAFKSDTGWMPMIGADDKRIAALRPRAERMAAEGFELRLVQFTGRTILDTLKPRRTS